MRQNGTSRAYLIERLRREGHVDLLAAIDRRELSAYAAAVSLGWTTRHETNGRGSTNQARRREHALSNVTREPSAATPRSSGPQAAFSDEILGLFLQLEPLRKWNEEYAEKSLRLSELLGLEQERIRYFVHVNETGSRPPWPPGYCGYDAWHKVRAVRLQLLTALEERSRANPAA